LQTQSTAPSSAPALIARQVRDSQFRKRQGRQEWVPERQHSVCTNRWVQ